MGCFASKAQVPQDSVTPAQPQQPADTTLLGSPQASAKKEEAPSEAPATAEETTQERPRIDDANEEETQEAKAEEKNEAAVEETLEIQAEESTSTGVAVPSSAPADTSSVPSVQGHEEVAENKQDATTCDELPAEVVVKAAQEDQPAGLFSIFSICCSCDNDVPDVKVVTSDGGVVHGMEAKEQASS
eukprot:TRINITY_DN77949_c0_g1_i1.p1 TRINITY_DN77949_c0_g1~~TRINITY_DN77949_c0_g1_i1.p1  ORF type:complete len:210 (-),score=58.62 TRINITY_DN77949_c0_g1_i1:13-573(-)